MANGPGKRIVGPFQLVDVGAEREAEDAGRSSGPFPSGTASDFELTTQWQRDVLESVAELKRGQVVLLKGQQDLTVAFGGVKQAVDNLAPRVQRLEAAARWRVWVIRGLKAAVPLGAALLGRYAPELAKHVPELVQFLETLAASGPM